MCIRRGCTATQHAIIFLSILSLLLLTPSAPNLNSLHPKSTTKGGGDVVSPSCTSTSSTSVPSNSIVTAFLYGVLFTSLFMFCIALNSYPSSSSKTNLVGPTPSCSRLMGPTTDEPSLDGDGERGGLDYVVLRTFPVFAYSKRRRVPRRIGKGTCVCVICQSEFRDGQMMRWLPDCDHLFHLACIDVWLASHKTCPCCRADLDLQLMPSQCSHHGSISSNVIATNAIYNDVYECCLF